MRLLFPVRRPALLQGVTALLLLLLVGADQAPAQSPFPGVAGPGPTPLEGLNPALEFFPNARHRRDIPALPELLGFPLAQRAATSEQIHRCLTAWTQAAPDRTRLVEYARSHGQRPLHYLVITSPANLRRLDEFQQNLVRLADPRNTSDADATRLIQETPAVAWLAATIHGDETEGSDALLAVAHHLLASEDPAVQRLLEDLIVIIDPLMNPDGRDRFLKMIAENRGMTPSVDDQALQHSGYWPYGRGNHYLFDLNRDWLFATQPETRGRIAAVSRWNPVLFVDAHGMGPQDTHLFSPPREPVNANFPPGFDRWTQLFGQDQAAAFDQAGLVYYSGEWLEQWYPGYSDAWASYRGAIGILYEQARIAEDGVRRPEGRILSYRESVQHHVVGAMANLATTQTHAKALLNRLRAGRQAAVDPQGPYARRTFAVLPTGNRSRLAALVDTLQLQGIELHRATADLTIAAGTDQLGRPLTNAVVPAGSLLIPNRQPLGHLLAAFLEFDPRFTEAVLADERGHVLRGQGSRVYDTTAWSLTHLFGLPAWSLDSDLPDRTEPYPNPPANPAPGAAPDGTPLAWAFDGADDLSVTAAARLMERGVRVRCAEKPFRFNGPGLERGTILVTRLDNRTFTGDLAAVVAETARELGLPAQVVATGEGEGDLPDLGGSHFFLLTPPRIAVLSRDAISGPEVGSIWHTLDTRLGIRHSRLDAAMGWDLARYNVLIVPERWGAAADATKGQLKAWVEAGGTLIAIGSAAGALIPEAASFSRVRPLTEALPRLAEYELQILKEWQGRTAALPALTNIWAYQPPASVSYPWDSGAGTHPEEKELRRRDGWQAQFMPSGSILATRLDTNHWLTAGTTEPLPVLTDGTPLLMSGDATEAPVRFGFLAPSTIEAGPSSPTADTNATAAAGSTNTTTAAAGSSGTNAMPARPVPPRIGWSVNPPGTELYLRMSGLLWPEAAHRFAHTAWMTRESLGRGQVILFASNPTLRSGTRGATRVFLNAVVIAPGAGTSPPLAQVP